MLAAAELGRCEVAHSGARERPAALERRRPVALSVRAAWRRELSKPGRSFWAAARRRATIRWPLSELVNWGFLHQWGDLNGRAPSLFNGGLLENYGLFWLAFLGAASYAELTSIGEGLGANGDYKLDPLGLATGKDLEDMRLKELKNGRVAMMAITGFAVQEFVYGSPVVEQTGMFFGRF